MVWIKVLAMKWVGNNWIMGSHRCILKKKKKLSFNPQIHLSTPYCATVFLEFWWDWLYIWVRDKDPENIPQGEGWARMSQLVYSQPLITEMDSVVSLSHSVLCTWSLGLWADKLRKRNFLSFLYGVLYTINVWNCFSHFSTMR